MSIVKKLKLPNSETIYDLGAKWSNVDQENILYDYSNIITFESIREQLLKKCIVNISPIQGGSGDPTPENVRAISGWNSAQIIHTGKNLLNFTGYNINKREYGITFDIETDENGALLQITANGTDTSSGSYYSQVYIQIPASYAKLLAGKKLCGANSEDFWIQVEDAYSPYTVFAKDTGSGAIIQNGIANVQKANIILRVKRGATVSNLIITPMILDADETDINFEPFIKAFNISFPTEVGTVYGGVLDVIKGILIINRAHYTLNNTDVMGIATNNQFYINQTPRAIKNTTAYIISDQCRAQILSNGMINTLDRSGEENAEEYLSRHNGSINFIYEIEPITYELTPIAMVALIGINNILCDAGTVQVELNSFYSDIEKNISNNLIDNKLIYQNNQTLLSSHHSITNEKLGINSNISDDYTLNINGTTLTNSHIVLQKSDSVSWSSSGAETEPAIKMIGAGDKIFKFKFSNSGLNVDIGWDWTAMDGAGAALRAVSTRSDSGQFVFFARKPNTTDATIADCTQLTGAPTGLLVWNKTSGSSSTPALAINAASASTYNLYINGPSYTKGNLDIGATSGSTKCSLQYDYTLQTLNFVFS